MRYEMRNPILEKLVREGRIRKKAIARVVPQARGRGDPAKGWWQFWRRG